MVVVTKDAAHPPDGVGVGVVGWGGEGGEGGGDGDGVGDGVGDGGDRGGEES